MIPKIKRYLKQRKSDHMWSIIKLTDNELRVEKLLCTDNISRAKFLKTGCLAVMGIMFPKVQELLNFEPNKELGSIQIAIILWLIVVFVILDQYESSNLGAKELINDEQSSRRDQKSTH